jgi:hypothetical protein
MVVYQRLTAHRRWWAFLSEFIDPPANLCYNAAKGVGAMQFFINEILEDEAVRAVLRDDPAMAEEGRDIARRITEGEDITPPMGRLPLFVLAYLADYALEKNTARGIPREVTVATLKDVNIWLANYDAQYGGIGLAEFCWLIHHYTGDLFRLGRLQFRLEKPFAGLPAAEVAIETHIPQGEPLDTDACLASFEQAKMEADVIVKTEIEKRKLYETGVDLLPTDTIVTLCTCTYEYDDARLLVIARKLRPGESPEVDTSLASMKSTPVKYPDSYYADPSQNPYKNDKKFFLY